MERKEWGGHEGIGGLGKSSVFLFFLNSFGSRVLDQESLTLALSNLSLSFSVLLMYSNYIIDLMHILVGKIIFNLCVLKAQFY